MLFYSSACGCEKHLKGSTQAGRRRAFKVRGEGSGDGGAFRLPVQPFLSLFASRPAGFSMSMQQNCLWSHNFETFVRNLQPADPKVFSSVVLHSTIASGSSEFPQSNKGPKSQHLLYLYKHQWNKPWDKRRENVPSTRAETRVKKRVVSWIAPLETQQKKKKPVAGALEPTTKGLLALQFVLHIH